MALEDACDPKAVLFAHAGLPLSDKPESVPLSGFTYTVWLLEKNQSTTQQLWADVREILMCLSLLNTEMNGSPPSGTSFQNKQLQLDRNVVYAINAMLHYARTVTLNASSEYLTSVIEEIAKAGWVLSYAFDAILAGDCDDLIESVQIEAWALDIHVDVK